jgi:DNA-binding transcriptional LysR family regulator
VPLFDRANPITPTAFGEIILQRSDTLVAGFGDLLREIALTKGVETGSLSISAAAYPAEISALEAVGKLSLAHPDVACSLLVKDPLDVAADVFNRRCDLGIADISEAALVPELQTEGLRTSQLHAFCRRGHPLAALASPSIEQTFDYPWVATSITDRLQPYLTKTPRRFGYYDADTQRISPRLRVESVAGILRIVLNSDALGSAPMFVIADEIAEGRIVALPIAPPWFALNYGFLWRRGRSFSPAALAYMQIVREIETRLGN